MSLKSSSLIAPKTQENETKEIHFLEDKDMYTVSSLLIYKKYTEKRKL